MQKCATRPSGLYTIELIDIVPQKTVSTAIKTQQKKELKRFPMNAMMPPAREKCPGTCRCPDFLSIRIAGEREDMRRAGYLSMTIYRPQVALYDRNMRGTTEPHGPRRMGVR